MEPVHRQPLRVKPPYVPKVTKSAILVCPECKGRYIKTRAGQEACIKCIAKAKDAERL